MRPPATGLGTHRWSRWVRLARGRPRSRVRARRDVRAGEAADRARRPSEPLREDPGDGARRGGDRGFDRGRAPDQRDADLLARAPCGRCRGVRQGARTARRRRRRSDPRRVRRELLRLPRRHRGRPPPRRGRVARIFRDGSRSTMRSSPTSTTSRSSPVRAGMRWPLPVRVPSAASGLPRRRRTPRTATSSTSRSSSARTRSTRCRSRRSRPSRTTASVARR